ncbi:hypothetical protein BT96DRAFT_477262 [Gymnopus androsaceus JB14]|uniref:hAT-like transposase RNase-H fold domain-containing protein n=1 Tax=Gymnopus androsaceus JB14 TaxID=1447944 RepID=A0A6A4GQ02_9AGAR|nr:hypothetical protein BT96DRAFT_477262 [Gymnopus androsaceus JB14]
MLEFVARLMNSHKSRAGMKKWPPTKNHIRCLAHIINLATQAVLQTHSKSKHYDPKEPEKLEPDVEEEYCDEIGLIQSIVVKACSSAKRGQLFKDIQLRESTESTLQLLLDMAVRWSSTYVMLDHAEKLKPFIDTFIYEIGLSEKNLEKR